MSREKNNKSIVSENNTIGKRLRQFAKDKYGTVRKLAELLEMSEENLSQYTRDKSKPGANMLLKLNELGCDLSWLLTGKYATTPKEMFDATFKYKQKENPYDRRINELEEENRKLKKKLAVYEKALAYINKSKEIE